MEAHISSQLQSLWFYSSLVQLFVFSSSWRENSNKTTFYSRFSSWYPILFQLWSLFLLLFQLSWQLNLKTMVQFKLQMVMEQRSHGGLNQKSPHTSVLTMRLSIIMMEMMPQKLNLNKDVIIFQVLRNRTITEFMLKVKHSLILFLIMITVSRIMVTIIWDSKSFQMFMLISSTHRRSSSMLKNMISLYQLAIWLMIVVLMSIMKLTRIFQRITSFRL